MNDSIILNLNRDEAEGILYGLDPMANISGLSNDELKDGVYKALERRADNKKEFFKKINKSIMKKQSSELMLPPCGSDFYTHHTRRISTNMSHLQGSIRVDCKSLLEAFGSPTDFQGDKVDWEWVIEKDGVVATIYNWKNGPKYGYIVGPEEIKDWNIGGHSSEAIELVKSILLIHGVKC
jgi:hypothetical protein